MDQPARAQYVAHRVARVGRHVKDHFIPHERNGYKPHALKHGALLAYSIFFILLKVVAVAAPIALPSSTLYSSAITSQNIINLTNQARSNIGLSSLVANSVLSGAAQAKADDMVIQQYFAHTSPSGKTTWDWFRQGAYAYRYAGENLAVHFSSAEETQSGWMASPTHRANIVNGNYTEIGVGIAQGTFENVPTIFVVQFFGTPKQKLKIEAPLSVHVEEALAVSSTNDLAFATPTTTPAVKGVTQEGASKLVMNEAKTRIVPTKDGYTVAVAVEHATSVQVQVGGWVSPLTMEKDRLTWSGTVAASPDLFGRSGENMSLLVSGIEGSVYTTTLAYVAPESSVQPFYVFNDQPQKTLKLFRWFTISRVDDAVRQVYIYFIIFLVAALLLNIMVKIHIQHLSVIAHALVVIVFAGVLALL